MGRIKLGDGVRDTISGWEGIAVGRYEYLNGCVRIGIGGAKKDGEPEEYVFDEQQVVVVEAGAWEAPGSPSTGGRVGELRERGLVATGGPRDHTPPPR